MKFVGSPTSLQQHGPIFSEVFASIIQLTDDIKRPTVKTAQYRNRFVAALADQLFLAHAQLGSKTEALSARNTS